ncbi:MAG: phytoene desaturase family protein [Acidobacteriota bacterium]
MPPKVTVIGAGPGGLANAMLLAKAGFDVTVLERRQQVGGRTSTIEAGGFRFDLGPTFFLYPRVLRSIFAQCGRDLDNEVDLIRLDPHYDLNFGGRDVLQVTSDVDRMKQAMAQFSAADAENLEAFLDENRRKLEAFRPVLESPFNGLGDVMKLPMKGLLPLLRPFSSVDDDLGRFFSDPRLRLAFSFQSKYLGMSPFKCPSLFTILSFLEYEHGVFHPRGGCGAISSAMARVAEELGAEIRLGEEVQEICFEGKKAVAVRTERGVEPCDALVVNADFAHAMTNLVPNSVRRRWSDRKLAKKRYSCSTYMMYLGLEGQCNDLAHHTIFLADDYKQGLADIEKHHRLSEDPSFYVHNPAITDASMAPPGGSSLYVLAPVTHQHPNVDWRQERTRFRRTMMRQLARLGLEDIERRIRYEKIVTPKDWESDLHIYRGATFSLAHSLDQLLHLRPRNRFEDLDGVYLVGGGTHPGSGLPVIFESARITSRLMVDDFAIDPAWEDSEADSSELPGMLADVA